VARRAYFGGSVRRFPHEVSVPSQNVADSSTKHRASVLHCAMTAPTSSLRLCFLASSLLAACDTPAETEALVDAGAPAAIPSPVDDSTGIAYPTLCRSLELPELPGGVLLSTGRHTTSLRDGLSLSITTSMAIHEVRDYYSTALGDRGWEEAPSRVIPGLQATRTGSPTPRRSPALPARRRSALASSNSKRWGQVALDHHPGHGQPREMYIVIST
jgi:hypothetical protein